MQKSAAQIYKDYKAAGGTLSFKDFLNREKEKMFAANGEDENLFIPNKTLNDSVHVAIRQTLAAGGYKEQESGKTIFGINKTVFIVSSLAAAGLVAFIIYNSVKK